MAFDDEEPQIIQAFVKYHLRKYGRELTSTEKIVIKTTFYVILFVILIGAVLVCRIIGDR